MVRLNPALILQQGTRNQALRSPFSATQKDQSGASLKNELRGSLASYSIYSSIASRLVPRPKYQVRILAKGYYLMCALLQSLERSQALKEGYVASILQRCSARPDTASRKAEGCLSFLCSMPVGWYAPIAVQSSCEVGFAQSAEYSTISITRRTRPHIYSLPPSRFQPPPPPSLVLPSLLSTSQHSSPHSASDCSEPTYYPSRSSYLSCPDSSSTPPASPQPSGIYSSQLSHTISSPLQCWRDIRCLFRRSSPWRTWLCRHLGDVSVRNIKKARCGNLLG